MVYLKKEDNIITKESLRIALRLFISIILYREKDKVNIIYRIIKRKRSLEKYKY